MLDSSLSLVAVVANGIVLTERHPQANVTLAELRESQLHIPGVVAH
jgi:hypothetical protein